MSAKLEAVQGCSKKVSTATPFPRSLALRGALIEGDDRLQDMLPPRDPDVSVRVLEDYGDVMLSIGSVFLQSGSVHLLPREEAEHLIRENVVQDISLERE